MSGRIFVQDTGTGLSDRDNSDWLDAANLMALAHSENITDYKVSGLSVSADYANDEATVSTGQARIKATNVDTVDHSNHSVRQIGSYQWDEVTVAVVLTSSETVSISSTGQTDIYLDTPLDSGSPDQIQVTTSQPSSPHLKLATVDADAQSVDESFNNNPSANYANVTVNSALDAQSATVSTAPSSSIDVARKNELDGKADLTHASRHESGGSDSITFANLANQDAHSILINTSSNLPSAGTADRLFVETDTGRVLYDDGSSWVEVGLTESQIDLVNLNNKDHTNLTGISADDHHSKYTDSEAQTAVEGNVNAEDLATSSATSGYVPQANGSGGLTIGQLSHTDLGSISSNSHHTKTSSASELTDVSPDSTSDAHHSKYTDTNAQSAVEGSVNVEDLITSASVGAEVPQSDAKGGLSMSRINHAFVSNVQADDHHQNPTAGTGLTDEGGNQFGMDVVTTGSVTLSSGKATIDTGVAKSNTATFMVAFGPGTDDADVAADIRADSSSGNYEVDIQETDTSVGNPTVEYDIVRVR